MCVVRVYSVVCAYEKSVRMRAMFEDRWTELNLKYRITNAVTSLSPQLDVTDVILVSARPPVRRSILPSFRCWRSTDINLSADGLACRATPRRDETNWEIMPLNAAVRPDLITVVFSNTSPTAVYSLSFYFTYRRVPDHRQRFNYSNNINWL